MQLLALIIACVAPERASPAAAIESVVAEDVRGNALFDPTFVHEIALDVALADGTVAALDAREWTRADVTVDGVMVADAAIRLKGGGSFQPFDDKPSFKVELDRFVDDAEIDGLDELVLNNMVIDPSMLRERLAYEVYRAAGVAAPRAAHALVVVNGAPYGLYTLVEETDGRFLDRWYADDDGPMYEIFDADFTPEGVAAFDHDGGPDDRSVLLGLADALADPAARLTVEGAATLDVDAFVRYFAVSAWLAQFDAYPYSWPGDDVVLYVDPADDRIDFLPHGADETFADRRRPIDYVYGLVGAACLADPDCAWAWKDQIWAVQDLAADMDLAGLCADIEAQIAPHALADPRAPQVESQTREAWDVVRNFVDQREQDLLEMAVLNF